MQTTRTPLMLVKLADGSLRLQSTRDVTLGVDEEIISILDERAPGETTGWKGIRHRIEEIQWGDLVGWAAKHAGVDECDGCKARRFLLNHLSQLGLARTIAEVRKTLTR